MTTRFPLLLIAVALASACGQDLDFDGVRASRDCDDTLSSVRPGAPELCDGLDNDCDGSIDEGDLELLEFHADADLDGFGSPTETLLACAPPEGWTALAGDCDDNDDSVGPFGIEVCDGRDNDCDGEQDEAGALGEVEWFVDLDGDGFGVGDAITSCNDLGDMAAQAGDCDDLQAAVHPGADEFCDEDDNDCDGLVDEDAIDAPTWFIDADRDGFGSEWLQQSDCLAPDGFAAESGDCDDNDTQAHPLHLEVCDGIDNDCDQAVDENNPPLGPSWYPDGDGDGYGTDDGAVESCDAVPDHSLAGGDCNDVDPTIHPGAAEPCGGVDLNCDGGVAPYCESCLQITEAGLSTTSGLYVIDPDGASLGHPPQNVHCDMQIDGGGWTLVQRTVWDWTETSKLLTDFESWRTVSVGSTDEGQAYRLAGELWPSLGGAGDHMLVHHLATAEGPSCAPLYYLGSEGFLDVTDTSATLTPVVSAAPIFDSLELSALDSGPSSVCVYEDSLGAVPWFLAGCCETCPSLKGSHWSDTPHPSVGYTWRKDAFNRSRTQVCSGLTPIRSNAGSKFGAQTMEYYVR